MSDKLSKVSAVLGDSSILKVLLKPFIDIKDDLVAIKNDCGQPGPWLHLGITVTSIGIGFALPYFLPESYGPWLSGIISPIIEGVTGSSLSPTIITATGGGLTAWGSSYVISTASNGIGAVVRKCSGGDWLYSMSQTQCAKLATKLGSKKHKLTTTHLRKIFAECVNNYKEPPEGSTSELWEGIIKKLLAGKRECLTDYHHAKLAIADYEARIDQELIAADRKNTETEAATELDVGPSAPSLLHQVVDDGFASVKTSSDSSTAAVVSRDIPISSTNSTAPTITISSSPPISYASNSGNTHETRIDLSLGSSTPLEEESEDEETIETLRQKQARIRAQKLKKRGSTLSLQHRQSSSTLLTLPSKQDLITQAIQIRTEILKQKPWQDQSNIDEIITEHRQTISTYSIAELNELIQKDRLLLRKQSSSTLMSPSSKSQSLSLSSV